MITDLLIRALLGTIRAVGYTYWFLWRRHTYVSYYDDIEPLGLPEPDQHAGQPTSR